MTTLRLLSQKPDFDERAFAHSEEFREALDYALAHSSTYKRMTPKQQKQYMYELAQLMEGRNLLFKQGGKVVKGADGIAKVTIPDVKLKDFDFNYTMPDDSAQMTAFADDYFFNNAYKPLIQSTIKSEKKQNQFLDSYKGQTGNYIRTDGQYGDPSYDSSPA